MSSIEATAPPPQQPQEVRRNPEETAEPIAEADEFDDDVHGSSMAQTVFNIVKNIVGEGMLSLPAGVAAGTGLVPSCLIASAFGLLLGSTFGMMGRVCHNTGAKSHKECGMLVCGPILAQTMAMTLMVKTGFTCVSYAMVLGGSYSRILHFFGLQGWFASKQAVLVLIVVCILTPLCLQRDLSALSYTSLFGICCEVFVASFMQWRLLDGSYSPIGKYYTAIKPKDRVYFGEVDRPELYTASVTTFVLLASLSTAFIAHYNAPKFYVQMRRRSPERFSRAVAYAFSIALAIYCWVMIVGYLSFGEHCEGNILNNYADSDPGATAARIAIGFAVLFGFPLSFTALRDATLSAIGLLAERKRNFIPATICWLALVTLLGASLDDLGLVNSLGGAILGALITMIFPGLLMYYMLRADSQAVKADKPVKGDCAQQRQMHAARTSALIVVTLGVILLFVGTAVVLLRKFAPEVLALDV
mmetsp:Transcript_832/g.2624  ORF Transcript_832/g.2624 Transcript_832/m.2624 type:complete len:473 (-) Transcript_832:75-1493(-)